MQFCKNSYWSAMLWAIWHHLHNLKKREKHPSRSVTLSKVAACNLTKSNTHPWVFFMFFKLYKRYKIVQRITYVTRSSKWRHQLSQYIKRYFKRNFSLMQSANFEFYRRDVHPIPSLPIIHYIWKWSTNVKWITCIIFLSLRNCL